LRRGGIQPNVGCHSSEDLALSLDEELIKTLERIRRDLSEPSFSGLVRGLLKERLGELGILNEDARKALGLTRVKDSQNV